MTTNYTGVSSLSSAAKEVFRAGAILFIVFLFQWRILSQLRHDFTWHATCDNKNYWY